jgi:hypothetical protein
MFLKTSWIRQIQVRMATAHHATIDKQKWPASSSGRAALGTMASGASRVDSLISSHKWQFASDRSEPNVSPRTDHENRARRAAPGGLVARRTSASFRLVEGGPSVEML